MSINDEETVRVKRFFEQICRGLRW
jgi:hypothetical protein